MQIDVYYFVVVPPGSYLEIMGGHQPLRKRFIRIQPVGWEQYCVPTFLFTQGCGDHLDPVGAGFIHVADQEIFVVMFCQPFQDLEGW